MDETKLDKFSTWIRSSKVQNILALYLTAHLLYGVYDLRWMLALAAIEPGAAEMREAIFYHSISMILSLFFLLWTNLYRLSKVTDIDLKILKFNRKIYSEETAKLCFEPLIADWKNEYAEAISTNKPWQARYISLRYAYAYLAAMFRQSRLGRLFEFIFRQN